MIFYMWLFFFFKQKTAYEMRISDWSSDVCSSDLFALNGTDWTVLKQIGLYFAYAGSFVFGSGLAIVPFLYGGVVKEYGWLTDRQFVDAVAVAMITPGPVVITTGFIGYLVTGFWGAVVAAIATFLPS